jgi:hypothetical protein
MRIGIFCEIFGEIVLLLETLQHTSKYVELKTKMNWFDEKKQIFWATLRHLRFKNLNGTQFPPKIETWGKLKAGGER